MGDKSKEVYCQMKNKTQFPPLLFFLHHLQVLTPVRIYLLIAKVPTKIDCHFHYLDIQAIESKNPTHFSIATSDRTYSFVTTGDAGNFSSVS